MQYSNGLRHAELTDVGRRRKNNQDSFRVVVASDEATWRQRGHIFMVADGMGAHAAGELASKLAVDYVPHLYNKYRELSPPEALQRALQEANAEVHRRGEANIDFHNMGTTASVLVLLPQGALVAHIGDSRVYRQRGQQLEQLTFDHSVVWELRKQGQSAGNLEAAQNFYKNVITRSLGPQPQVQIDVEGPFPVEVGDSYLLCSDGLTGQVTDEEIGSILASFPTAEAAQMLIDLANLRGGPDNITVLIAKIEHPSATNVSGEHAPLMVTGTGPKRSAPLFVWILAAALVLAGAGIALAGAYPLAALAAGAGLICLCVGLVLQGVFSSSENQLSGDRRLGEGPYTRTACKVGPEFVQHLAEMTTELRQATVDKQWTVDLVEYDRLCQSASSAAQSNQLVPAMQGYGRALSFLMRELRKKRRRTGDENDSAVDL